jgi:hypothetical protein
MLKRSNIHRCTGGSVRKHRLIEDNITRNINFPRGSIKTLVAFMHRTIPQKHTHLRPEFELVRVIFAETRPTSAPKNAEKGVVRLNVHESE